MATNASFIASNPDAVEAAVRALVKAKRYMTQNKNTTIEVVLKNISYSDKQTSEVLYDRLKEAWTPELKPENVRNFVEMYCKINHLKVLRVEDLLDLRFLKKAVKES
jgi:ABC-type nitrate/sulfonate/bicarbonate transport system substrate-binding protein